MLNSTLYATSPERLTMPFLRHVYGKSEGFKALRNNYIQKGYSGVKEREVESDPSLYAMEFRTDELWGEHAFFGLARNVITAQVISSSLIAFQQLPMDIRDKIIFLEKNNHLDSVTQYLSTTKHFSDETSRQLAIIWVQLRRDFLSLAQK